MAKRTSRKAPQQASQSTGAQKSSVSEMSFSELERELASRKKAAAKLMAKRERLAQQLDALDREIAELGLSASGIPTGGPGSRPRNKQTLPEALVEALNGAEMSVTEVAEAVQKAGYRSTSTTFRTIVNQALLREKKLFKKVGRGIYTAR